MNHADILVMAKEVIGGDMLEWSIPSLMMRTVDFPEDKYQFTAEQMFKFATLAYEAGRKDENEACAKVCENDPGPIYVWTDVTQRFADAIRARREQ